jgi:hypothetical protein
LGLGSDLGRLVERVVEEGLDIFGQGVGAGGRARGLEGSVEPGVEDLDGGVRGGGYATDGEDVGVVDGAGVDGFLGG